MKYCPNPACPTLLEVGMVAEYEDQVVHCSDCGTLLISAESPPDITPQPPDADDEWLEDSTLLVSFELRDDAEACQADLAQHDIPVLVEEESVAWETQPSDDGPTDEEDEEVVAETVYSVYVPRQYVFRAMEVLDSLVEDDADSELESSDEE